MKKPSCISECCEYVITPAIEKAGWMRYSQISFYEDIDYAYKHLSTEYVLCYKPGIPIAVISVTENNTNVEMGIKTAINNAKLLDVPCAFSSNGSGFTFFNCSKLSDCTITTINIDQFPTPDELWRIYIDYKNTNAVTSAIEPIGNNGFTRILIGLLDASVSIITIIFRILDNLFSTSTHKRILHLTDRKDEIKDREICGCQNIEDWIHNIQEKDWQHTDNYQYSTQFKNVWINNNGNISIYQISMNEFVALDKYQTYKQYPSDFFDILLLDIHKKETSESERYQEILNYYTDAIQVAIKPQKLITQHDIGYFGEPHLIDVMEPSIPSNEESTKQVFISEKYIQPSTTYNNKVVLQQQTSTINNSFRNNSNVINVKNIISNKTIINTTAMARQTSFQHQIELAVDLKAYLIRLQENLANAAQKYHDKTNSLYEAGMMDENHQALEEYMFETVSRIKNIVEQINESDIPFVDRLVSYLEESQSIK